MEIQTVNGYDGHAYGDLLYGVKSIAEFLGMRPKQAQHRCDDGTIPTFKIGRNVCARKSTLREWLDKMERAHAEDG